MVRLLKHLILSPTTGWSLRLAKIPKKLVTAIETLTKQWATIVQLLGDQSSITSDVINFSNGIFQGDSISVYFLYYDPLSYMLGKLQGYNYGNDRRKTTTHNFFVDDLKLYSSIINVFINFQRIFAWISEPINVRI